MSINASSGEPIRQARPIMQIPGVNEQQINVLLLCELLHMGHKGRKVTKVTAVVRLRY